MKKALKSLLKLHTGLEESIVLPVDPVHIPWLVYLASRSYCT